MGAQIVFDLTPRRVPRVQTKYRRIVTDIPAPESIPALERLRQFEPRSMSGQPPIVWDRAEGIQVYDRWGNMWLDWSSGVVVANAGHGHPAIRQAMIGPDRARTDPQLLLPVGDSRRTGRRVGPSRPGGTEEGLPADHRLGGQRVCDQTGPHPWQDHRRQEDHVRDLPERLPRPDPGLANGRRHPGPQGLDRQPRPRYRPGAVPGRLPRAGHELRGLSQGPGRAGRDARSGCRRDERNLPGRQRQLCTARVHAEASQLVRQASGAADLRRGAGRLWPDRHVLGLRALRRRARSDLLRQGHQQRHAAIGRDRAGATSWTSIRPAP